MNLVANLIVYSTTKILPTIIIETASMFTHIKLIAVAISILFSDVITLPTSLSKSIYQLNTFYYM